MATHERGVGQGLEEGTSVTIEREGVLLASRHHDPLLDLMVEKLHQDVSRAPGVPLLTVSGKRFPTVFCIPVLGGIRVNKTPDSSLPWRLQSCKPALNITPNSGVV